MGLKLHQHLGTTGLHVNDEAKISPLLFIDTCLRGIGQVMLQNNAYTGLLFLFGIAWNSPLLAGAAVLGVTISTLIALILGVNQQEWRAGLFGFNGVLVAIALFYFLELSLVSILYVTMAAAFSTFLLAALSLLLKPWNIPAFTAPFVLTTWIFILAGARFGRLPSTDQLPTAGLPSSAMVEGVVSIGTLAEGLFTSIAQVFFQGNLITGIIFVIALAVSSRRVAALALLGAFIAMLMAWWLGAAELAIRDGAYGFNAVLVVLALASFLSAGRIVWLYVVFASATSTIIFAALSAALAPVGMPAMTAPFVLTTWLFILAAPAFKKLSRG